MNDLLQAMIAFFEDWLDVSDTGRGDLARAVAEMRSLSTMRPVEAQRLPVVDRWLEVALAEEPPEHCVDVLAALERSSGDLRWVNMPEGYIPSLVGRFAYTQIVGPVGDGSEGCWFECDRVAAGFSLQAPNLFYPPHNHLALEYYGILSGLSEWQIYYNRPMFHPAGAHIYHPSEAPHAMQTHDDPLLSIWLWTGEMTDAVEIPTNGTWL